MGKILEFKKTDKQETSEEPNWDDLFAEAIERNKRNKERMQKDRSTSNKSTLRSYRIKD